MVEKFGRIGYVFTASHCTLERSYRVLEGLVREGYSVTPIMSENTFYTDTRFTACEEFSRRVEGLTGNPIVHTIRDAEPLGPKLPLDLMIVAPCTGNTLAKVASGISDTAATMAIKAHLRCDRPTILAVCSNDALSRNLSNIAAMLMHKSVYLVPMRQDDPRAKPHSLVAELEMIPEMISAVGEGRQLRPLFI